MGVSNRGRVVGWGTEAGARRRCGGSGSGTSSRPSLNEAFGADEALGQQHRDQRPAVKAMRHAASTTTPASSGVVARRTCRSIRRSAASTVDPMGTRRSAQQGQVRRKPVPCPGRGPALTDAMGWPCADPHQRHGPRRSRGGGGSGGDADRHRRRAFARFSGGSDGDGIRSSGHRAVRVVWPRRTCGPAAGHHGADERRHPGGAPPEAIAKYRELDLTTTPVAPAESGGSLTEETTRTTALVRAANITPQLHPRHPGLPAWPLLGRR